MGMSDRRYRSEGHYFLPFPSCAGVSVTELDLSAFRVNAVACVCYGVSEVSTVGLLSDLEDKRLLEALSRHRDPEWWERVESLKSRRRNI